MFEGGGGRERGRFLSVCGRVSIRMGITVFLGGGAANGRRGEDVCLDILREDECGGRRICWSCKKIIY